MTRLHELSRISWKTRIEQIAATVNGALGGAPLTEHLGLRRSQTVFRDGRVYRKEKQDFIHRPRLPTRVLPEGDDSALASSSAPWSTTALSDGAVFSPLSFEAIMAICGILRNYD